jgi:hypothetical protein
MFNLKEWERDLIAEQDKRRKEWRDYTQTLQYKMERAYGYPISPAMTPEQERREMYRFVKECFGVDVE